MQYSDFEEELHARRKVFLDISTDLFAEAHNLTISLQRSREMEITARRAALRLIPKPKLGFEHLYFRKIPSDQDL